MRVFAFREQRIGGTPYLVVPPESIVEISDGVQVEHWDGLKTGVACRMRVYGEGHTEIGPLDRVLVVQQYKTPEMDYFSDQAMPFLKALVDKYTAAGVNGCPLLGRDAHSAGLGLFQPS